MELDRDISNLVFEGGGPKGIAYVGMCRALDELGLYSNVKRAAGASAGAINALFSGLNFSIEEMENILWQLDFEKFMDSTSMVTKDIKGFFKDYGFFKGDYFYNFIGEAIKSKTGSPDSTFEDIERVKYQEGYLDMSFIATNLSTGLVDFYNYQYSPKLSLRSAVRRSMSIPLFFRACKNDKSDTIVDGGVISNFPVKFFDKPRWIDDTSSLIIPEYYEKINKKEKARNPQTDGFAFNPQTIGFKLDTSSEIAALRDGSRKKIREIDNFFDYTKALIAAFDDSQQNHTHLHSDDWMRTVYIDCGDVSFIDFSLSDEKKKFLVQSGYDYTKRYFEWRNLYNDGNYTEAKKIRPRTEANVYEATNNTNIVDLIDDTNSLLGE